jgi:hypothetical protein
MRNTENIAFYIISTLFTDHKSDVHVTPVFAPYEFFHRKLLPLYHQYYCLLLALGASYR